MIERIKCRTNIGSNNNTVKYLYVNLYVSLNTPKVLQTDMVMQLIPLSSSSQEIQRLTLELREKDLELEGVRGQPDHEKDREIHRLSSALKERERCEATRVVLCTSLAEEADQLRGQLCATVKVCQELLSRLERGGEGGGEMEDVTQQEKSKEVCGAFGFVYFRALLPLFTCALDLLISFFWMALL